MKEKPRRQPPNDEPNLSSLTASADTVEGDEDDYHRYVDLRDKYRNQIIAQFVDYYYKKSGQWIDPGPPEEFIPWFFDISSLGMNLLDATTLAFPVYLYDQYFQNTPSVWDMNYDQDNQQEGDLGKNSGIPTKEKVFNSLPVGFRRFLLMVHAAGTSFSSMRNILELNRISRGGRGNPAASIFLLKASGGYSENVGVSSRIDRLERALVSQDLEYIVPQQRATRKSDRGNTRG